MRWTVGTKLATAFAVLLVAVAVIAGMGIARERRIAERVETVYEHGVVATEELGRAAFVLQRARTQMHKHVATPDPAVKAALETSIRNDEKLLAEALDRVEAAVVDPARRAEVGRVREKLTRVYDLHDAGEA